MKYNRLTKRIANDEEAFLFHSSLHEGIERLAELEDKIERGKIDYVANKDAEIARLTAELAALQKRLKNAVELPCKVGDTVYWIEKWRIEPQIDEYTVQGFIIDTTNEKVSIRVKLDKNGFFVPLVSEYKDKQLFFDRTLAETYLAELNGGRQ